MATRKAITFNTQREANQYTDRRTDDLKAQFLNKRMLDEDSGESIPVYTHNADGFIEDRGGRIVLERACSVVQQPADSRDGAGKWNVPDPDNTLPTGDLKDSARSDDKGTREEWTESTTETEREVDTE